MESRPTAQRDEATAGRGRLGSERAWLRGHPLVADSLIAVAVFALGVLSDRVYYDVGVGRPHNFRFATAVAVMALLALPLALRRKWPPVTLACVSAAIVGYTVFGISEQSLVATVGFVAIYSVGAYCEPRVANWVRGVCIVVMFGSLLWVLLFRQLDLGHSKASVVGVGLLSVGSNLFFFIAAWAIGDVARTARLRARELAQRNRELQVAQDVIAGQAVLDERVRIAREVHDVVAHHVSVMGVQAGAARRVMVRSPDQAAQVLSGIEASSRQAVAELHRLLGFLRSDGSNQGGDAETNADGNGGLPAPGQVGQYGASGSVAAPQPSLAGLDALVGQLNGAGLVVSARVEGTARPLATSVDLSAYRVVQEALTNALKHGGVGTMATVTLTYTADALALSVVDDGRGRSNGRPNHALPDPDTSSGHGLVGMRERVALHGGHFQASRQPGSGFAVHATFPLSGAFRSVS
jgi:signal transduction histidine kinase